MKKGLTYALGLAIVFLGACNSDNEVEIIDLELQFEENKQDISDFFEDRGITDSDTLDTAVRYSITSLNSEGETIEVGDIVMLDYVGYRLSGSLLGTTFQEVVDTTDVFSEPGEPLTLTHTFNGWAFNELFATRAGAFRTNGFKDGVTTILNMSTDGDFPVGSSAILGVPSRETAVTINGTTSRVQGIPADVIIYEFRLIGFVE